MPVSRSSSKHSVIPPRSPRNFLYRLKASTQIGPLRSWVVDILPQLDNTALYNQWDKHRLYYSRSVNYGITNNYTIASTWISCLGCPDDDSLEPGQGNLSYVVNGGFSRWPGHTVWNAGKPGRLEGVFPPGLTGSLQGVVPGYGNPLDWGSDIARLSGATFLCIVRKATPPGTSRRRRATSPTG